jgi:hypothetical protein
VLRLNPSVIERTVLHREQVLNSFGFVSHLLQDGLNKAHGWLQFLSSNSLHQAQLLSKPYVVAICFQRFVPFFLLGKFRLCELPMVILHAKQLSMRSINLHIPTEASHPFDTTRRHIKKSDNTGGKTSDRIVALCGSEFVRSNRS